MPRAPLLVLVIAMLACAPARADAPRVQVEADRAAAEHALAILDTLAAGREPAAADWQNLFATAGYRRLKARESGMGRAFTDADFQAFLRSPEALAKRTGWHVALDRWSTGLVAPAAARAFAYLPPGAVLRATIFPMIKPRPNQFVFDLTGDPAIFLYLDPAVSPAKAANTMAHELHHIGMGAACNTADASGTGGAAALRPWMGAFGEGLAMMAAAGGPDRHPHADSPAAERAEWDANAARFAEQLAEQNRFFLDVLDGRAGDSAAIEARMRGYFGVQGPWYTVGWRMAQVIERNLGRAAAIDAFCRSDTLLAVYNDAAARQADDGGVSLPRWDAGLAAALAVPARLAHHRGHGYSARRRNSPQARS